MQQLFNILIILHVAGGTVGLLCGTIAAVVVKGKRMHLLNGKIFFYSMLLAAVSALIISRLPHHKNIFLFAVGGFTFYMITTGYRSIALKRTRMKALKPFTGIDLGLLVFGICFSLFLLFLSVRGMISGDMFSMVPGVFGLICLNFAIADFKVLSGKTSLKSSWLSGHIYRMMGSLIASYTAFLVVNVQINMQWILWLLPSLIGGFFIVKFIRRYVPKNKTAVPAAVSYNKGGNQNDVFSDK